MSENIDILNKLSEGNKSDFLEILKEQLPYLDTIERMQKIEFRILRFKRQINESIRNNKNK